MRSKKQMYIAVLTLFLVTVATNLAYGNVVDPDTAGVYNRIVFVIDCSNSMNYHDEDKLVNEIVKMFVDSSCSTKTDIGFITYNDRILTTYPLTPMSNETDRNMLKSEIDKMTRSGSTDIGMAINYGIDIFLSDPKEGSVPKIVLVSDGETDLTYTRTGRTYADSQQDEESAYDKSKKINCPIYSIGISRDGSLNTQYLNKIASNTGGKQYDIQNSGMLLSSFADIFSDVTSTDIVLKSSVAGTGEVQTVTLDIPGIYAEEVNVILQNKYGIDNIEFEGINGSVFKSRRYSGIKITTPWDSVTVNFTARKDDEIKISTVSFINILPKLQMPENLSSSEIDVTARLYNASSGIMLTEPLFYNGLTANLIVTDNVTGEGISIPMENAGDIFTASYKNNNPKSYDLKVIISGAGYLSESAKQSVTFTNTPPDSLGGSEAVLLKNKETVYELKDYFNDPDGDTLYFEIAGPSSYESIADIQDSKLIVNSGEEGETRISIRASDGRGGVVLGFFDLKIVPFWIYYRTQILFIGCIIIILLLVYLILARKTNKVTEAVEETAPLSRFRFNGARFEGYFLDTKSGNEIPVLNWNSSYIENKQRVSLGEMLQMMDVDESLSEAHKIYLDAGNNHSVVFSHDTDCIVSIGSKTIPRGKKEVLNYDDRLYIVFEDHATELEVRYKRARRMVVA